MRFVGEGFGFWGVGQLTECGFESAWAGEVFDHGGGVFTACANCAGAGGVELDGVVFLPEDEGDFVLVAGFFDDLGDDFGVSGVEVFAFAVGDLTGAGDLVSRCQCSRREGAFPVV